MPSPGSASPGTLFATAALPAAAAAAAPTIAVFMGDQTVAVGGPGVEAGPWLAASERVDLTDDTTVTYDSSGLSGVAAVVDQAFGGPTCTKKESFVLVCSRSNPGWLTPEPSRGSYDIVIRGLAEGSGTLKTTLKVPGRPAVSTESTVRVGVGVDLAVGPDDTNQSVAPGAAFTHEFSVTNVGKVSVEGFNAVFDNTYGVRAGKKFTNCSYVGDRLRACAFDLTIAPGETLRGELPYKLGADTAAPGRQGASLLVYTRAEFADYADLSERTGDTLGKPGTDGKLELTAAPARKARGTQADTNPSNDGTSVDIRVTGENGSDMRALGARITGQVGDVAEVQLGFRNDGPATIDKWTEATLVDVTVPKGTTAVEVPEQCAPVKNGQFDSANRGQPGKPAYRCLPGGFVPVGETVGFPFSLRIDQAATEPGQVAINVPCDCDVRPDDTNSANDTAPIEIKIDTTAGGGGGSDGGGLPITGPAAGMIAGAGGLLLVAGLAGVVVAWRRRTRFVS
ncbi:LPXTG cell wall anchor domain-containing protein [Asanoa siamensis]|uniref:LPXTG-motif cell wall-anchored protein n=1 Tax=Asanoa siamensis TaxID=926357 RepID=A0ABQ4CVQ4_9ACTN|nr:LPXTG cell wall anchor domain-containing protein [Asanoa siamensis]GIF75360.1 hypothetical protein Asi02nite_48780 [Asanoa siamensis]